MNPFDIPLSELLNARPNLVGGVHTSPNYWLHRLRAKREGLELTIALEWRYVVEDQYYASNALFHRLSTRHTPQR